MEGKGRSGKEMEREGVEKGMDLERSSGGKRGKEGARKVK